MARDLSYLDSLINGVQRLLSNGAELEYVRPDLNFSSQFTVVDNPSENRIDIDVEVDTTGTGFVVRTVTDADSPVTVAIGDFIKVNTSNGPVTLNLPTITAAMHGRGFIAKLVTAGNNLTILRGGADLFDDAATSVIISTVEEIGSFIADSDAAEWSRL